MRARDPTSTRGTRRRALRSSRPSGVDTDLLERESEQRSLESLLDFVQSGRGGLAVIEGAAGIGKTRLLQRTVDSAAERKMRVLVARGSDLERRFAYGVVRQLFDVVAQDRKRDGRTRAFAGLAAQTDPVFAPNVSDDDDSTDRSGAVLHGLYELTRNLTRDRPVLLAVDDGHWADIPSLLFMHFLVRRFDEVPVGLLLACRPGQPGPEADLVRRLAAGTAAQVVRLRPLSPEATAELVRAWLGERATPQLCRACYAATGGNPFLVGELSTALAAGDEALDDDAVVRLVPDTVSRHVLVRLSQLGSDAVAVARAIAVLGAGAELRHAASLTGLSVDATAEAVDSLVAADVLAPGPPLDFRHPLVREAIYADSRPAERALAHARAAQSLSEAGYPAERVALHLLASEPAGSEWAAARLRAAAREAAARGAPQVAVQYLERALLEPPAAADRQALLFELGVAASRAAAPRAVEYLTSALAETSDAVGRATVSHELAALHNLLGPFESSLAVLEAAIDALGDTDGELRYSLEAELAVLAVSHLEARRRVGAGLQLLRERAREARGAAVAAPLLAVVALDLAETDAEAEEAATYARAAFGDGKLVAREGAIPAIGAASLVVADRPSEAELHLDQAIAAAQNRGSIQALRVALVCRAFARNRLGWIVGAEADARLTLELSEGEPSDPVRPVKVAQLVEALLDRGELDEAERLLPSAELARQDRDSKLYWPLADAALRLLLARMRYREACELADDLMRRQEEWGARNPGWASTRSLAAHAFNALGEHARAHSLAASDLDAALAFGAARPIGIALRTLALIEPNPPVPMLREAAAVHESSESRLELARTLLELGSALRRAGARRDAREPLQRAFELAEAGGADAVAQAARTELVATGARPRRSNAGLTPSEQRVATMAAEGLSNREIAQALYLSPKTVEMHLSHTYGKLGIRSRAQLARALESLEIQGASTGLPP